MINQIESRMEKSSLNHRDRRIMQLFVEMLKRFIDIEKQDLQKAFEAGKDSKVFMVETEFEIQYDYLETFDQFYNELKGE